MKKYKQSPYILNYTINRNNYGIYMVIVNTKDNWIPYQFLDDYTIIFGIETTDEDFENYQKKLQYFEPFLPNNVGYLRTSTQEKGQITILYIPYSLILENFTLIK